MFWITGVIVFGASALIVLAMVYAFSGVEVSPAERLTRLWQPLSTAPRVRFREKQVQKVQRMLSDVGKLLPPSTKQVSMTHRLMVRAGFRRPEAVMAMRGVKVLLPAGLLALAYFTGVYTANPIVILGLAALAGYLLPEMWLSARVRGRQRRITLALPDCLDLLVVCVEAGLALDHALLRVAHELHVAHPDLCEELDLVNAEIRVGRTRIEALHELAARTAVEDIKALVAMLVQTERFGTSIAQSLRVHSEELRTKRRQRAEELAAKATVKMIPALVFFIFPAMFVVILGPAVISFLRKFP